MDKGPKRHEQNQCITITELSPLGFGNPDATIISIEKRLNSGELPPDLIPAAIEIIVSTECIIPAHEFADGCIDGRPANNNLISDTNEHAKVAGGGGITSLAMVRGNYALHESAESDLINITEHLASKGIHCGAHTGEHKHADNTDCGANDKFRPIIENAIIHRDNIALTSKAILETAGFGFDQSIFDSVMENWAKTTSNDEYFAKSTGSSRFDIIKSALSISPDPIPDSVIEHLSGDHKEGFIILNFVPKTTFSQNKFASLLAQSFPEISIDNHTQAFVVDIWRVIELAQAISTTDCEIDDQLFLNSLHAGIAFQISTAATLTDGSLDIYSIN